MTAERGRPPSLGPVFAYEWLVASRRWQGYALRSSFVLMLLGALVVVGSSRQVGAQVPTIRGLAQVGGAFYQAVIGTQLTLVLLAAPAATAGAICLDRARGTLTHLLVTDLTDGEIVLGKLGARLVPVLGLVGCTLPVMALLTLLGGVDPDAMLGAFCVTLGLAVLGCSLALAFSLWAGKTHEALLGTYAVWGIWLLSRPMLQTLGGALGVSFLIPPNTTDPFRLAFAPYLWPGTVGWGDYLAFLGVTCGVSAGLVGLSVFRLRAVCTRDPSARRALRGKGFWLSGMFARLGGPSLDGNPVLWREWHRGRPSRGTRIVGTMFVGLAVVFSAVAVVWGGIGATAAWVNGFQVSVGLLLLSVSASTSLAEERVRGSLDVLLATPLSTRQIVLGKWLGAYRVVPPLAVLPGLVVLSGAWRHPEQWPAAVLTVAYVLASGAAVTSLGLATATWFSRLGRAVAVTVTAYVAVAVGWLFLSMTLIRGGPSSQGTMMGSPFFWAGEVAFEVCGQPGHLINAGWAIFWTLASATVAVALLLVTLFTFNACLGRVDAGFDSFGPELVRIPKNVVADVDPLT